MEKNFTWVSLYKELALALLEYKDDRGGLVEWIYNELGKVTRDDGKSLVGYLKQKDGSKIIDIDPFSIFGIFNRNISWPKRTELLGKFKEHFKLSAEIPTDFNGIPTLDNRWSFFYSWYDDNDKVIHDQWLLYEKVVKEDNIEKEFDQVIDNGMPKYSLTMTLFWIAPDNFLALDTLNRSYLETYGFPDNYPDLHFKKYKELLDSVQNRMNDKSMPFNSFIEISYTSWKASNSSPCVWMWSGNEKTFSQKTLNVGSSAKDIDYPNIKTKEELGNAYRNIVGNTDVKIPYAYWDFIKNVKRGDIVVVFSIFGKKYHKLYGWGRFASDVTFVMSDNAPIQREVEWNSPQPPEPIEETKTKNTMFFHKVEGVDADNIIRLLGIQNNQINPSTTEENHNMPQQKYKEYIDLLQETHNLVLTGAPGTGKTYLAHEIAKEMGAVKKFVQFHPSYDYTDFVEGLRPVEKNDGQIGFERKDGIFKDFCREAIKVEKKPYVFIIDEINRGEASKIFGELFYAIDPGYRGKKDELVQTQYQNLVPESDVFAKGFYVPENVYILATMNDIDRSVESMDFAMRRRFTWKEITPSDTESMLDSLSCANEAKDSMKRLNKAISEYEGLGSAYQIGPSYYLKLGENGGNFHRLWEMNLEPLLKEYLRGFRNSNAALEKFNAAYFNMEEIQEKDEKEIIDEED